MAEGGERIANAASELPEATTAAEHSSSRDALAEVAEEQAALRRVATLVARGAAAAEVFDTVAAEMARLLGADAVILNRFDSGEEMTVLAHHGLTATMAPVGTRFRLDGENTASKVWRTQRAARMEDYSHSTGPLADLAREQGIRSTVGAPIIVDGKVCAIATVHWLRDERPPAAGTEERMSQFAELLGMAIANTEAKTELAASRRRIVTASDAARRRIERDLHDGVQQQLVSLSLKLSVAAADAPENELREQLASASDEIGVILDCLVEIARGIHPAILSQGGLKPALDGLARRSTVPIELSATIDRPLAEAIEVAAYYVVSEALTNIAKHARASQVHIDVTTDDRALTLVVQDDGVGGATLGQGSGLVGLQDRVEALGGTMSVSSSVRHGTSLVVTLPIAANGGHEIMTAIEP